jgi:hypothetical protein
MKDLSKKCNNPCVILIVFGEVSLHKVTFDSSEEVCFVFCSYESFVLYILVLFKGRVPQARGSEIPCFSWMCKTVEVNAITFTPPKIWVRHENLRHVY